MRLEETLEDCCGAKFSECKKVVGITKVIGCTTELSMQEMAGDGGGVHCWVLETLGRMEELC